MYTTLELWEYDDRIVVNISISARAMGGGGREVGRGNQRSCLMIAG